MIDTWTWRKILSNFDIDYQIFFFQIINILVKHACVWYFDIDYQKRKKKEEEAFCLFLKTTNILINYAMLIAKGQSFIYFWLGSVPLKNFELVSFRQLFVILWSNI